ncbi:hypothetical protein swp_0955 [Shewanella piezotolerans WP3]|uniref:Uncharacterized protein n=1 Tax=Shewanella piezotolerans (strain WP3 / JCM 13877) TaxID=225849 RepID=B8CK56_SHEPW|nr:hypothetical protein swp_0955 [Shewanella piezotolerans WP3]
MPVQHTAMYKPFFCEAGHNLKGLIGPRRVLSWIEIALDLFSTSTIGR